MGRTDPDETVQLRPPRRLTRSRRAGVWLVAIAALLACGIGTGWNWGRRGDGVPVRAADERAIFAHTADAPTVFRFTANPDVLVLDFPTLAGQGRALNRLAALVEKAGAARDQLLDAAALDTFIRASGATPDTYYYGHNYRAADVARLFSLAERDAVALTPEERWLGGLARQQGWTSSKAKGALLAIPRVGADEAVDASARATILRHELSHGEYFTVPAYATHVLRFWRDMLTDEERARFRAFLAGEGYNPGDDDLMANEAQAYLVHTPDPALFSADRIGLSAARLAALRAAFIAGMPPGWLRDATLSGAGAVTPGTSPGSMPRRQPGCRRGARCPMRRAGPASRLARVPHADVAR